MVKIKLKTQICKLLLSTSKIKSRNCHISIFHQHQNNLKYTLTHTFSLNTASILALPRIKFCQNLSFLLFLKPFFFFQMLSYFPFFTECFSIKLYIIAYKTPAQPVRTTLSAYNNALITEALKDTLSRNSSLKQFKKN